MNPPPLLEARNITVRKSGAVILNNVSLSLPAGSMSVLLGPNGAGKTTLIRVLAGILTPTHGEVLLGGVHLHKLGRTTTAKNCAYLPQQSPAPFDLTVEEAVALGRYPHLGRWGSFTPTDFDRVVSAMERVGLTAFRQRLLPTLSGGERQRVFLARALAQEAPIFLFDEPLAALDIGHQLELMAHLGELHQAGHTILAALHDLRPALDYFPRAILLNHGRLIAEGATETVVRGPALAEAFGVEVGRGEEWCFRMKRAENH